MATRCCWPPESFAGWTSAFAERPTRAEQLRGRGPRPASAEPFDVDGRLDDVAEGGEVGEEVEALEDDADLGALAGDLGLAVLDEAAVLLAVADERAVDVDVPGVEAFEVVDAAQEGALAGAAGTDDDDDLAAGDVHREAAEDFQLAVALVDVDAADHRACDHGGPILAVSARRQSG